MADFERDGYTVLAGAVPQDAVRAALRCIGLGIRRHGLPGGQDHADAQGGTFLPELRDDPAIWGARPRRSVLRDLGWKPEDEWAEPQILLRFPDEAPVPFLRPENPALAAIHDHAARPALVPHVDEEPPWAGHKWRSPLGTVPFRCCYKLASDPIHVRRRYKAIVGVALTEHGPDDGALWVWPGSHLEPRLTSWQNPVAVPLKAGDAVVMHPKLAHAGSWNLGHTWQARVYFRLLGAPE